MSCEATNDILDWQAMLGESSQLPVAYRDLWTTKSPRVANNLCSWQLTARATSRTGSFGLTLEASFIYNVGVMARTHNLGEFEQIVLLSILRLGETAYGVSVRAEITEHTGRSVAPGALYTTLDRLEDKGFVTSRVGDPTPERGGRAKRYYKVSAAGVKAVTRAQNAYQSLLEGLEIFGRYQWPIPLCPSRC